MLELTAVVFDDEELFHILFTRIFKAHKINVICYPKPDLYFCMQPGIEKCPVDAPCVDFLLTDQKMPDMTGLEFLQRTKQMDCKILDCRKAIISGNWLDGDLKEAKKLVRNVFAKSEAKELIGRWIGKIGNVSIS
jgi:CheY-like chemotaxis protein